MKHFLYTLILLMGMCSCGTYEIVDDTPTVVYYLTYPRYYHTYPRYYPDHHIYITPRHRIRPVEPRRPRRH